MPRSAEPGPTAVLISAGIVLTAAIALFVGRWELYYNSDYALISLISNRIADGRDFPLFVYKVGYEGMIFDGLGTAAVFRLFGMGPYTMNAFEAICTIALFVAFYFTIRRAEGKRTAAWALLFLAFSCPFFYGKVVHPSPNYAQTLLLGTLWTWLYMDLLAKARPGRAFALGFVGGFGLYTYQTILFFLASTGAHAMLLGWNARPIPSGRTAWKEWLAPRRAIHSSAVRLGLNIAATLCGIAVLLAVLGYMGVRELHWRERTLAAWDPTQTAVLAVALWGLQHLANFRLWHAHLPVGFAGFLVGYSPKLYYNWALKLPSAAKTSPGGDLPALATRASYAAIENLRFLNLTQPSPLHVLLAAASLGLMAWGLAPSWARIRKLLRGRGSRADAQALSPCVFLAAFGTGGFVISSAVSHISNSRYMVSNWLFFALALAAGWTRLPRAPGVRAGAAVILAAFWGNTLWAYRAEYLQTVRPHPHLAVRDWLERRGVTAGYADYWIAYSLDFLSNERLVFEPLYSNYIPDYAPRVAPLKRIAYVDSEPPRVPTGADGRVWLEYRPYRVVEQARVGDYRIQILDALAPVK